MPNPIIGLCGSCGAPNTTLHYTQYKVLVDSGMIDPVCSGCEERIITKRKVEIMRDDSISLSERKALAAKVREKVTDAPQASAPAPAATAAQTAPKQQ